MNMAGGDNDMDDHAAALLWDGADSTTWRPPCWSKTPEQLADEEKAMNHACFEHAATHATLRNDPPQHTAERPF